MENILSGSGVPPPTQIQPIVSIDDLVRSVNSVTSKEESDRFALDVLFELNEVKLTDTLKIWAAQGFSPNHILYEVNLNSLEKCSDGIHRPPIEYIEYLRPGCKVADTIGNLQHRLPGMTISYSYTSDYCFRVHVTKL